MKNWLVFTLIMPCILFSSALSAQISENLLNLKGRWYLETRNTITYTTWLDVGSQAMENLWFSIVCGDTLVLSRALIQYSEDSAELTLNQVGQVAQTFKLTEHSNKALVWVNKNPNALPKQLEWTFSNGGYATFAEDGVETEYRRDVKQPIKLKFRASLGANLNQYANPAGVNHFLAQKNTTGAVGETQMLSGKEASVSVGLLFPSAPMALNFELGMAYRQVGIQGSFRDSEVKANNIRDGYYRNYNFYLALAPEIFVGKRKDLSLSVGLYADIFQQRFFRGSSSAIRSDLHQSFYGNPGFDIDPERGFLFGLQYRVTRLRHLQPQLYLRYMHGVNNTNVRAISLGAAVDFEIR